MRSGALLLGLAVLLVVGLSMAYGQEAKKPEALRAQGVVKSVDATTLVLTVKKDGGEAKDMTFVVNDKTKVTEGDAAKTLADVKAQGRVTVKYEKAAEGVNPVAIAIQIMKPRPAGK